MRTLADALGVLRVQELKALAKLVSDERPGRKADLIATLTAALAGGALRESWNRLDELQRAAVAEAVHSIHGRFDAEAFRAKYGGDPDWGLLPGDGESYHPSGRPAPRKTPAWLRLFIPDRVDMPDDVRERLREFVPEPRRAELETLDELPEAVDLMGPRWDRAAMEFVPEVVGSEPLRTREMERTALRDLQAVLRLVQDGRITLTVKKRHPTAASVRAVARVLDGGDFYHDEVDPAPGSEIGPVRAFAWPILLDAGTLVRLRSGRLVLSKAGSAVLDAAPGDRADALRGLWDDWVQADGFDELTRVDAIRGQSGRGGRSLTDPGSRRVAVSDALAECPVDRWVAIDEFFRYVRATGHDFDVVDGDAWDLYILEKQYGSLGYAGYGGWEILEARYALCLIFEYAATLGLVDVAYLPPAGARPDYHHLWGTDQLTFLSRYDGLKFVRLTPLGAYVLGAREWYEPGEAEPSAALDVLPNFEIVDGARGLSPADRLLLERYAEPVSEHVWRISMDTLLTAIEAGESVDVLRSFLATHAKREVPAAVGRLLDDIAARARALRDAGPARLIECGDPRITELITADCRLAGLCIRAGDTRVVVPAAAERAFRRALREVGYVLPLGLRGMPHPRAVLPDRAVLAE